MAEYLSRPRNSTSLWRNGETGADLGIGTGDLAEVLHVSDHAWVDVNEDDPCLHIQLVKNKFSGYTVLVDGLQHYPKLPTPLPQTQTTPNATPPPQAPTPSALTQEQKLLLTECQNKPKTLKKKRTPAVPVLIGRQRVTEGRRH